MACIVHGVAKSRTRLSGFHSHTHNQETLKGHEKAAEKRSVGGSPLFIPKGLSGREPACQCKRRRTRSLGQGDPLEEEVDSHSSVLAWDCLS